MTKKNRTVVRLKTETYKKGNSYYVSKVLTSLKRKSTGFDILNDSVSENVEDMEFIEGIYDLSDGEYELIYNEVYQDYETSEWDFYGFKLIPLIQN